MHPGPMNRGVEIDSKLADDITRSLNSRTGINGSCNTYGLFRNINK